MLSFRFHRLIVSVLNKGTVRTRAEVREGERILSFQFFEINGPFKRGILGGWCHQDLRAVTHDKRLARFRTVS